MLVIYDIADTAVRGKVERLLRESGFVYLFRNARWTRGGPDMARLKRRVRAAGRGHHFRILIVAISRRGVDRAEWIRDTGPGEAI